jgi:hypothetical protein
MDPLEALRQYVQAMRDYDTLYGEPEQEVPMGMGASVRRYEVDSNTGEIVSSEETPHRLVPVAPQDFPTLPGTAEYPVSPPRYQMTRMERTVKPDTGFERWQQSQAAIPPYKPPSPVPYRRVRGRVPRI